MSLGGLEPAEGGGLNIMTLDSAVGRRGWQWSGTGDVGIEVFMAVCCISSANFWCMFSEVPGVEFQC